MDIFRIVLCVKGDREMIPRPQDKVKVEGIYHHWPLNLCSACGNPHSSFLG